MNEFIALYTDASFKHEIKQARIAFVGECFLGKMMEAQSTPSVTIQEAEMLAIHYAVKSAIELYPGMKHVIVNSDNSCCVKTFRNKQNQKQSNPLWAIAKETLNLLGERTLNVKHIKAHSGERGRRQHMNRLADRLSKGKTVKYAEIKEFGDIYDKTKTAM